MKIFENPGQRLRAWAYGAFILECMGLCVGCFWYWIDTKDFLGGLLIGIFGVVAAYILCLLLAALGQLVESTQENAEYNRKLLQHLTRGEETPNPPAVVKPAPVPVSEPVPVQLRTYDVPKNALFARALREALTYQSDDKMRACLGKILSTKEFAPYWNAVQDILEEVPRSQERKAVEELLKSVE